MVCSQIGLSIIHTSKVHTKTYSNWASEICCHTPQSCMHVCTYVCMFLKTVTSKEIQFYDWVWSPAFVLRKRGQLGMELEGSAGAHRTGITSRQLLLCRLLRPLTLKHQRWGPKTCIQQLRPDFWLGKRKSSSQATEYHLPGGHTA